MTSYNINKMTSMARQRNMRIAFVNYMRVMRKTFKEESPDECPDVITKKLTDHWNYKTSDRIKQAYLLNYDFDSDSDSDSECEEPVGPMD